MSIYLYHVMDCTSKILVHACNTEILNYQFDETTFFILDYKTWHCYVGTF